MAPLRCYAVTDEGVARIERADDDHWTVTPALAGSGAQCIAADPNDSDRVVVGTFDNGLQRSRDGGDTWEQVGADLPDQRVLSVAFAPARQEKGRSVVYAGTEPSNLYRSADDGESWEVFPALPELPSAPTWSFPPRPWTHHVRWIAPDHHDPELLFVGIELGGVMRSRDGGQTWEDRKPGAYHDSHMLRTHPVAAGRVYEAAGEGVAWSHDAGDTWQPTDDGMDRHYSWALAVDPANPNLWYVSSAPGPFQAHGRRDAQGILWRKRGDTPWEPLGGVAPLDQPTADMPYALLTFAGQANLILAGQRSGTIILSDDAGDTWRRLDVQLPGILAMSAG